MGIRLWFALVIGTAVLVSAAASPQPRADNPARTPPMGWDSSALGREIDDATIRQMADTIVANGMKAAGYTYIGIGDGWQGDRSPQGELRPNGRFPDMKALAEYVHGKGLRLGLYSSPGPKTCGGLPGSYSKEEDDARLFAAWGIDYLRYEWCGASQVYQPAQKRAVYQKMSYALKTAGRPILFAVADGPTAGIRQWAAAAGINVLRTAADARAGWESFSALAADSEDGSEPYTHPGYWSDPGILNPAEDATVAACRAQMSLLALLAAPVFIGADVRKLKPEILETLTSPEVISINQDPGGRQGRRVSRWAEKEVWARPLEDGGFAVGLFNRGDSKTRVTVRWTELGLTGRYRVRDLWERADRGSAAEQFSADVPPQAVVLIRLMR